MVSNIHTPNVNPAPCEERSGVLFVGSFEHTPNRQAVRHLLADILPAVLTRLPRPVSAEFKVRQVDRKQTCTLYRVELLKACGRAKGSGMQGDRFQFIAPTDNQPAYAIPS